MTSTIKQKTTDNLTAGPPTTATATFKTPTVARLIERTIARLLALFNVSTVLSTVTLARSDLIANHAMIRAIHIAIVLHCHTATSGAMTVINPTQETEAIRSLDLIRRVSQKKPSNMHIGDVLVRGLCECKSATSSMQSRFFVDNFGSRDELESTGKAAVAINGATSPIWGTFNTNVTFASTKYHIFSKSSKVPNTMLSSDSTFSTSTLSRSNPLLN